MPKAAWNRGTRPGEIPTDNVHRDHGYATLTNWSCKRRVVAKAGHLADKADPRFGKRFTAPTWPAHRGNAPAQALKIGACVTVSVRRVEVRNRRPASRQGVPIRFRPTLRSRSCA